MKRAIPNKHGSNRCQDSRFQFANRAPPLVSLLLLFRLRSGGGSGEHGGEGLRRLPALPIRTDHAQGAPRRRRWHARPPLATYGSGTSRVSICVPRETETETEFLFNVERIPSFQRRCLCGFCRYIGRSVKSMVWSTRRMKYCQDTEERMGSLGVNLVSG